jgi:hypothetical protein
MSAALDPGAVVAGSHDPFAGVLGHSQILS